MKTIQAVRRLHDLAPGVEAFHEAVIAGLSTWPKTLPCKFLYDAEGSRLFDIICTLPAYYPTRTECMLLKAHARDIAAAAGPAAGLIEFGSGAGHKIRLLLAALRDPALYVPIDISRTHLLASAQTLSAAFPQLPIVPVCTDYTQSFALPDTRDYCPRRLVGFFPGSTIGNFTPDEMDVFLRQTALLLGEGALFIVGVDLPKAKSVLETAYNDPQGVTAAFNLNLLRRINRELKADFDLATFHHEARWDAGAGRIEMHLASLVDQTVSIAPHRIHFCRGETIHTENSHKYDRETFMNHAEAAGYKGFASWTDAQGLFALHMLEVAR